jgi:hypothetical protein
MIKIVYWYSNIVRVTIFIFKKKKLEFSRRAFEKFSRMKFHENLRATCLRTTD